MYPVSGGKVKSVCVKARVQYPEGEPGTKGEGRECENKRACVSASLRIGR